MARPVSGVARCSIARLRVWRAQRAARHGVVQRRAAALCNGAQLRFAAARSCALQRRSCRCGRSQNRRLQIADRCLGGLVGLPAPLVLNSGERVPLAPAHVLLHFPLAAATPARHFALSLARANTTQAGRPPWPACSAGPRETLSTNISWLKARAAAPAPRIFAARRRRPLHRVPRVE